ncbi:hypothetical protein AVXHC19_39360 [Acidovorax sacchari]
MARHSKIIKTHADHDGVRSEKGFQIGCSERQIGLYIRIAMWRACLEGVDLRAGEVSEGLRVQVPIDNMGRGMTH